MIFWSLDEYWVCRFCERLPLSRISLSDNSSANLKSLFVQFSFFVLLLVMLHLNIKAGSQASLLGSLTLAVIIHVDFILSIFLSIWEYCKYSFSRWLIFAVSADQSNLERSIWGQCNSSAHLEAYFIEKKKNKFTHSENLIS